jgi:hypothetical protein
VALRSEDGQDDRGGKRFHRFLPFEASHGRQAGVQTQSCGGPTGSRRRWPIRRPSTRRCSWIGCGQQDGGHAGAKGAHEALEKAGVTHVWVETAGGHEWQFWRRSLNDLAPALFR